MSNREVDNFSHTQALLEQACNGDVGALEQLFQEHRAYLRRVVAMRLSKKLRTRVDASDVVQETQMVATKRLSEYLQQQPVPFRLWLRQIAQDQLVMAYRRHFGAECRTVRREVALPERSSLQLARQLVSGLPSPSQEAARTEQVRCIRAALACLSMSDQEVLVLRNYERLLFDEIAYVLQIKPATARQRYGRALLRLNKIVQDSGLTESQI
jgi:RNA polymerase sigma-70 factor (ECF subfamily)